MKKSTLYLLSVLFTVSALPLQQEAELVQHALGLPTTSQLDPVAGSVQWRYQFEHDALEEVIEFVEVSASRRCWFSSVPDGFK